MGNGKGDRYFITAEILACASFILNTISVLTAEGTGPIGLVPKFDSIYQLKTILAAIGIFYFLISNGFFLKRTPVYIRIFTIMALLYSIPIINMFFILPLAAVFKNFLNSSFDYKEMIISQVVWSIPVLIIARDILLRVLKNK